MHAITKPRDTCYQIRPDKGANLVAIPAQVNLVILEYPTPIRAWSPLIVVLGLGPARLSSASPSSWSPALAVCAGADPRELGTGYLRAWTQSNKR